MSKPLFADVVTKLCEKGVRSDQWNPRIPRGSGPGPVNRDPHSRLAELAKCEERFTHR
jgi:hypothetical protein